MMVYGMMPAMFLGSDEATANGRTFEGQRGKVVSVEVEYADGRKVRYTRQDDL